MANQGAARSLPWHLRLEARVIFGIAFLVALSLGAVLVATTRAVTTRSFERASTDLDAARSAFYQLVDDRAEFTAAQAALVTALPVFRAHMTDSRARGRHRDARSDGRGVPATVERGLLHRHRS